LSIFLSNDAQVIIRPFGTKPLIEIYITAAQAADKNMAIINTVKEYLNETFY